VVEAATENVELNKYFQAIEWCVLSRYYSCNKYFFHFNYKLERLLHPGVLSGCTLWIRFWNWLKLYGLQY
jgi:hypothetical protein